MTAAPTTTGPTRRSIVLSLGFAAAMVAAAGFVMRVLFIRYLAGDFASLSRDYHWMTPVGYLLLFGAVAIPVALAARFLAPQRVTYLATWTFTALVVFDFLMPFTQIGRFPALVLAMGAGTMLARALVPRWDRVPWAATITGSLLAVAVLGGGLLGRRGAPAPGDPVAGAPNVLLIILDTVRADELGTYGYPRPTTPNIDALAARSVVFEAAISAAPWTLPSHGSMFTGQYAANLNADYKAPLDDRDSTLAEILGRRGYQTVGVVANVAYASWESGLARGFHEYADFQRSFEQVMKSTHLGRTDLSNQLFRAPTWRHAAGAIRRMELIETPRPQLAPNTAAYITDAFLDWHAGRDSTRPWFAFLNYYDAHDPYSPAEPYRSRFRSTADTAQPNIRDLYDAELNYLDEHLGRLLASLEERGALENTLLVITSDHGEHFGERNLTGHFNSIYMPLLRVPLIVRHGNRLPSGQRIAGEVSLRDLGATVLDVTGQSAAFPGRSLAGKWKGDTTSTSPAVASYNVVRSESLEGIENGMLSLARDGWHYILTGKKEFEELYRYGSDTALRQNLVGSDTGMTLVPAMRRDTKAFLQAERPR